MKPKIKSATYVFATKPHYAWKASDSSCDESILIEKNQQGLLIRSICRSDLPKRHKFYREFGDVFMIEIIGGPQCGLTICSRQESEPSDFIRRWMYRGLEK